MAGQADVVVEEKPGAPQPLTRWPAAALSGTSILQTVLPRRRTAHMVSATAAASSRLMDMCVSKLITTAQHTSEHTYTVSQQCPPTTVVLLV